MSNGSKTAPIPAELPDHPVVAAMSSSRRRHLIFLVPVAAFLVFAAAFAVGLGKDPRLVPSALIGHPVPAFQLPPVQGRVLGLATADLKGEVSLVNVFASWCVACREEHPLLMRLKEAGAVPIYGLNYKDRPEDAAAWLDRMGDPYLRTGADRDGRVAINWGVYGVPETFVVNRDGQIVYKQTGPITENILAEKILPLVDKLRAEDSAGERS